MEQCSSLVQFRCARSKSCETYFMCTLSKFATQQAENGQTGALLRKAPVAQLDRASDCGSEGRTFESCRAHHKNPVKLPMALSSSCAPFSTYVYVRLERRSTTPSPEQFYGVFVLSFQLAQFTDESLETNYFFFTPPFDFFLSFFRALFPFAILII